MAQAPVSVAKLLEGLTRPFVVGTAVSAFPLGRTIAQVYAWQWFVAHYRDPSALVKAPWLFAMSPVMSGLAAL
ncbi:hypothetical protein PSHT_10040 [Puccinia striiformis]|uniref:Uncharacterized protein n=1 Tax=Puccinia striiformis TaxID=27350 RepID=A0A2S4VCQ4_9BASI|nr:hypothetical protein PSHT_10040 [Puccinia striiformis]